MAAPTAIASGVRTSGRAAAADGAGRRMGRYAVWMWLSAVLSAFVNNTPIVVLLLPILVSVCLRTSSSPAAVLMPMGFATLIGGMATTIPLHQRLMVEPEIVNGNYDIHWLEKFVGEGA